MKTLENIKAMEINETEIDKAVGGAIIYNNGLYDVVNGETKICSFRTYDEAVKCARSEGVSTQYFGSKREYSNWLYPSQTVTYAAPTVIYQPVVYDYDYYIDEYGDIWVF